MSDEPTETAALRGRIEVLERENARLRRGVFEPSSPTIVKVPAEVAPLFDRSAATMRDVFARAEIDPARALVAIDGERYILIRASAFSIDFLDTLVNLYSDRGEREALAIARGFLFDIAHTIGFHDARQMQEKLGSREAVEKLTGGPIHFAYTGWAQVAIDPRSNPVPGDDFLLIYEHPYSFEAASFQRVGRRSEGPACIMNSGYSSGWCQASFDVELTALEVKCRARGDDGCFFVMAKPDRVAAAAREHFGIDTGAMREHGFDVPTYFERKRAEEEVRRSLERLEEAQEELVRKERLATVGLLVSGVAHEVNTPLGVAVTATGVAQDEVETMRRRFEAGALTKGDLRSFLDRAGQALSLVETNLGRAAYQITKFKRASVDHMSQEERRVDLAAYVQETLASLGPLARKAGIAVSFASDGELECVTFPGAISQIVTNFVTNTVMHAAPAPARSGGAEQIANASKLHVDVRLDRLADGRVALRYADDGRGMTSEVKAQAFQPFFTTGRADGGSGLGLHIVHSLVADVLRGRVDLETSPGNGAAFVVTFPVAQ
ncbi:MAG: XylR N-terminal domain-containing protein [Labilithrix sp.]|nr:XylR N-terminal domain-containing protein [Labilithrix sp.]